MDSKIGEDSESIFVSEMGQLEISIKRNKKFDIKSKKTVLGLSTIYRLYVGKNYMHFWVNILTTGSAAKTDSIISKSTI